MSSQFCFFVVMVMVMVLVVVDVGVVMIVVVVMVMMMVVGVWEEAFVRFLQLSECGSLSQQPTEENCYKFASNQRKFVSHSE